MRLPNDADCFPLSLSNYLWRNESKKEAKRDNARK